MQQPLVSVLMPAWNAQQTITESIDSILQQTFTDFELIVINDASTDQTPQILEKIAQKDPRVKVFHNQKNLGIAGTRNKAVELAQGEYLAWQDADDISYPQRLELQVKELQQHPDVGMVGGSLEFFSHKGVESVRAYQAEDEAIRAHIFRYSPVAQPVAMIRKECFVKVGKYDLRYPPAEDIDMSFRIGSLYKFANIQQPLLKYRMSETSATYQRLLKIELSTLKIRLKNIRNPAYHFGMKDVLFNLVQYGIVIWFPSKLKIALFNFIRNTAPKKS